MQQNLKEIKSIFQFQEPLKFTPADTNIQSLLVIGQVGSGKSTTLNYLNYIYCKEKGLQFDKSQKFLSKKSASSITKRIETQSIQNLQLIDTPGTNDPQKNLSDLDIQSQITQYSKSALNPSYNSTPGISGILNCFMVSTSQRIGKSELDSLVSILICFNYLHPEYQGNGPQISIILTNFSQNSYQNQSKPNLQDSDSENEETYISKNNNNGKLDEIIQKVKAVLVERLSNIYQNVYSQQYIRMRIEEILPKNQFYCFKLVESQNQDKENLEISRLLRNYSHIKNTKLSQINKGFLKEIDLSLTNNEIKHVFFIEIENLTQQAQKNLKSFKTILQSLKSHNQSEINQNQSKLCLQEFEQLLGKLSILAQNQDVRVIDFDWLDKIRLNFLTIQQILLKAETDLKNTDLLRQQEKEEEELMQKAIEESLKLRQMEEKRIQIEKERKFQEEMQRREMEEMKKREEEFKRKQEQQEKERKELEKERKNDEERKKYGMCQQDIKEMNEWIESKTRFGIRPHIPQNSKWCHIEKRFVVKQNNNNYNRYY